VKELGDVREEGVEIKCNGLPWHSHEYPVENIRTP